MSVVGAVAEKRGHNYPGMEDGDGAVSDKVGVTIDNRRPVETGQPGQGLLIEVFGVDQVVQAGLGSHGQPIDPIAKVVAVLGRDDAVQGIAIVDNGEDRAVSSG